MTELAQRRKLVEAAKTYYGCKESDGSHKKIIDRYNACKVKNVAYKLTYTDPWCCGFGSVAAIDANMTDIVPVECSCIRMIDCFKKMGCWVEADSYVGKIGDYVFYDWQDNGIGDNTGNPDHVGIITENNGKEMVVIEGNMKNAVGYRTLQVNEKYIRGFGVPKYGTSKCAGASSGTAKASNGFVIGSKVYMTGKKHYSNSESDYGTSCKPGVAKITNIAKGAKHPYHLVKVAGSGGTVYGWVDERDIADPGSVHVVVRGDTLWGIAAKYLGNGSRSKEIMELNGLTSTIIKAGQVLKLPKK